jgi:transcriptional regulator with XRE-family HTH domain
MDLSGNTEFADRVQGRLDRLDLSPEHAARAAGLPADFIRRLLDGKLPPPRGQRLVKLAEALATSVSYLVGLDPDTLVPAEYLEEEQGSLGLLAGDEDALLRAYRRLDVSLRAALLQVVLKMAPEPEMHEKKPRQSAPRVASNG